MSEQPVTIVVSMEGGVIQDISANAPVRVVVVEYDKNLDPRESPERFVAIWGQPHWFADWGPEGDEKEQECVAKILEIVDQAPRCDQCGGPRVNGIWEYTEDGFITDKDHEKKLCWFCWAEAQERRDHDA
jgi:hypothetical protein